MFPFAERNVSSALTGMLNGANPLFTVIIAAMIVRRMPSRPVLAGLAVGMTGAILMMVPTGGEGHSSVAGVSMILAALVSYGFALNIASPLQKKNGALPVIWRAQMVALLITAPLGFHDVMHAHWTLRAALAMVALGALGTGVAHVVMSVAAGKLGAMRASATTFLIPAVSLVLGIVVRHESVAALAVVGSAMCVGGAWLMRRARSVEEKSTAAALRMAFAFAAKETVSEQSGGSR
jgi:drug/metabolite transporter (DMT)-like permease